MDTLTIDTITIDTAGEIDMAWQNAGMPDDGLRIYGLRRSTYTVTYLAVPGNDQAPRYIYGKSGYHHVSGPTLADWQAQRLSEIDAGNAAHYRSLAAESRDPVNVDCFTAKAEFYAQRAASR